MDLRFAKIRLFIFTLILLFVSIMCMIAYHIEKDCECLEVPEVEEIPIETETIEQPVVTYSQPKTISLEVKKKACIFTKEERYLLAKIAMAEAEGESLEGKALVMNVILNRVSDGSFPDTIGEVIFQHSGDNYQFTSVKNGRIYKNEPSDDCYEAVDMIEYGWDESEGALYFEATTDKSTWHSRNLELLLVEGGHQFYK